MGNVPLPSVQPQQSLKRNNCPVKGLSMVAVTGWETQRVRGWLQKALGDLCSTSLFLAEGCFSKRVCWQPDPPWNYGDLQRRCASSRCPPSPGWVFPIHTVHLSHNRPPDQLLLLLSTAQAQPFSSILVASTTSGSLSMLFMWQNGSTVQWY